MSQTSSSRPASSTTAAVNQALAVFRAAAAGGADASPQYTLTSATASPSSRTVFSRCWTDAPWLASVAPVRNGSDVADYRAPAQRWGFCPNFLEPASGQEAADATGFDGPECLVEVVQGRARGQRVD